MHLKSTWHLILAITTAVASGVGCSSISTRSADHSTAYKPADVVRSRERSIAQLPNLLAQADQSPGQSRGLASATTGNGNANSQLLLQILPTLFYVPGCTDPSATNYLPTATVDNGSCTYPVVISGCTDPSANNYDSSANSDNGSCTYTDYGCTDPAANDYDPNANTDNGSCTYTDYGCTDPSANNYDSNANTDDGSCTYTDYGCTDPSADNYDPSANTDDGSCTYN